MLDPKEEKRYGELQRLAQELHIPMPEAFIEVEVRDKYGYVIQRQKQRSHSWTRNAYNMMFTNLAGLNADDAAVFGAGKLNIKETDGNIQEGEYPVAQYTSSMEGTTYGYRAGAADASKSIIVGSGTNAESFEDYALQTPIAEGNGAGQLNHVATEPHSESYAALVFTNEWVRYFNNNSGGNVSVNEVALVADIKFGITRTILTSRDKLASTVTVPDTGQLKVTYTIQLTYPA